MGNETLQAVVNNAKNVWGTLPNTNWYDEILHTALTHNHSLDISGGTEKATYSVGTSYLYQDGILDSKNDYSRFNLRTKADYKAFDWLNGKLCTTVCWKSISLWRKQFNKGN